MKRAYPLSDYHWRPGSIAAAAALLAIFVSLFGGPSVITGRAQTTASKSETNTAPKKNGIKGRVIDDSGRPVAGTHVVLVPAGWSIERRNEIQTSMTDEDGLFSFDGLADRPYQFGALGFYDNSTQYHLPGEDLTIRIPKGGVITGRVTNADGEPVVRVPVVVTYVGGKDVQSSTAMPLSSYFRASESKLTDDRGIYRIWGVPAGMYVVSAGISASGVYYNLGPVSQFDNQAPTYYPSSTFGSATQVSVSNGQEVLGIDIVYRGESGHAVSGTIAGAGPSSNLIVVLSSRTGDVQGTMTIQGDQTADAFKFDKISDGEYVLTAVRSSGENFVAMSTAKTVTVKGTDVSGINLIPLAFGSISGRITLENDPKVDCKSKTSNTITELAFSLRPDVLSKESYPPLLAAFLTFEASPDSKGEFAMKRVPAGSYRIGYWLPTEDWYLSAMTRGSGAQTTDVASKEINVAQGQTIAGLNVVMKNGAAGLAGRIVPKAAGDFLPSGLRVFLMPGEPGSADKRLRFAETDAEPDGSFKFKNLAPGSYRIIALPVQEKDSARQVADSVEGRASLLREAGNTAQVIELHACEKLTGYELKYSRSN